MDIRKYLKFKPIAEAGRPWLWNMLARAFSDLANRQRAKNGFKHARHFYESRIWESYIEAVADMTSAPNKHALATGGWLYMPLPEGGELLYQVGKPIGQWEHPALSFVPDAAIITEATTDGKTVKIKVSC